MNLQESYCQTIEQRWPKVIRDALFSHYATRNVTPQFPLALQNGFITVVVTELYGDRGELRNYTAGCIVTT